MRKKMETRGRKPFERIKKLDPEKKAALDMMLATGVPVRKIAEHIQKEWGLFLDVRIDALAKQLYRYKKSELPGKTTRKVIMNIEDLPEAERVSEKEVKVGDVVLPIEKFKDGAKVYEGVVLVERVPEDRNVLNELNELIEVQKSRLQKAYMRELEMPVLMASVSKEIRLLGDLLKQMADLQLALGIMARPIDGIVDVEAIHEAQKFTNEMREASEAAAIVTEILSELPVEGESQEDDGEQEDDDSD